MSFSTSSAIKITKENENRFREEVVDIFRVQKDAKRLFLCKDRREIGSLETKLGDLERDRELKIQRYNKDQRNLQWYLYDLRLETSALKGFQRFGGVTCMKKKHYSSFIREPRADYQHIKSIRRPLAPESSRPTTQSSILQFKDGSSIPQAVKREIVRRQTMRLETKRQELLDQDKQRRMQLEDTVGVYTRISLSKGSLKHRPTVSGNKSRQQQRSTSLSARPWL
ncbi:uncharacterized protein LOC122946909 isoform X2 [Acropora millepora]|uniref:uncharacterized protein LOC122946909 isoform X2 n=1 Tax=Acropora millepora TaxID=45264 RepID=UPI001CF2473F|nr:uncharacterized protein LOC122946909 isoform X2 [Acropora millepora]